MILIDSNVLLDIATKDPVWFDWSFSSLAEAAEDSALCINPLVYAEASTRYASPQEFDETFPEDIFKRVGLPFAAAFVAGRAHLKYRKSGGTRTSPLPDFYIGAHAAVAGFRILTRDTRRYKTYFPSVELIAP